VKKTLKVGDRLPNLTLRNQDGQIIDLRQAAKGKILVLFFYPNDNGFGCTKEVCAFRDNYGPIREAGAEVFGINVGSEDSHKQFKESQNLPFELLVDENEEAVQAFGIGRTLGLRDRITFIADANGIIRYIYSSMIHFRAHAEEVLKAVKAIQKANHTSKP
jgi:peroxiredoxin Q/BCP